VSTSIALSARGLVKSFKDLKAVAGVDLEVAAGNCVALLGPNGAGKTTTVEILEGLKNQDEGQVEIFGMDWRKQREEILEIIGVLLQETYLYKRFTVKETLELFSSFYKNSVPIDDIMKRMQLTDKADTKLMALSGGQKQRVYIGCSLINNPKLLFLDEPTTGLDPQARHMIWDLLTEIKASGCSILLTTHYMEEAETLADQVMIIDHGKIITKGTPRELIKETCGEQILRVELDAADKAKLENTVTWLKDSIEVEGGYETPTTNATEWTISLVRTAEQEKIAIKSLQMRDCTLEDVFLKLTGRGIRDA
jgi:ABC-2 type transport system ATP-binding protein